MKGSFKDKFIRSLYNGQVYKRLYSLYINGWTSVTSRYSIGTNIFEKDWDLLIVLDTCRIDALEEVADDYGFIDEIDSIRSVGCTSSEWVSNTFTSEFKNIINKTAYLSANAFPKRVIEERKIPGDHRFTNYDIVAPDDFYYLEHAWELNSGHPYGYTLPGCTTDRAIRLCRELNHDRFIVHYTPPHSPYIGNALNGRELCDYESDPFESLRRGKSYKKVWNAYIDNLHLALQNVDKLINNVDANKVVITADHGEAFGEFGVYGHRTGLIHPHVVNVPWVKTTAEDSGSYEPSLDPPTNTTMETEDQLKSLGYL